MAANNEDDDVVFLGFKPSPNKKPSNMPTTRRTPTTSKQSNEFCSSIPHNEAVAAASAIHPRYKVQSPPPPVIKSECESELKLKLYSYSSQSGPLVTRRTNSTCTSGGTMPKLAKGPPPTLQLKPSFSQPVRARSLSSAATGPDTLTTKPQQKRTPSPVKLTTNGYTKSNKIALKDDTLEDSVLIPESATPVIRRPRGRPPRRLNEDKPPKPAEPPGENSRTLRKRRTVTEAVASSVKKYQLRKISTRKSLPPLPQSGQVADDESNNSTSFDSTLTCIKVESVEKAFEAFGLRELVVLLKRVDDDAPPHRFPPNPQVKEEESNEVSKSGNNSKAAVRKTRGRPGRKKALPNNTAEKTNLDLEGNNRKDGNSNELKSKPFEEEGSETVEEEGQNGLNQFKQNSNSLEDPLCEVQFPGENQVFSEEVTTSDESQVIQQENSQILTVEQSEVIKERSQIIAEEEGKVIEEEKDEVIAGQFQLSAVKKKVIEEQVILLENEGQVISKQGEVIEKVPEFLENCHMLDNETLQGISETSDEVIDPEGNEVIAADQDGILQAAAPVQEGLIPEQDLESGRIKVKVEFPEFEEMENMRDLLLETNNDENEDEMKLGQVKIEIGETADDHGESGEDSNIVPQALPLASLPNNNIIAQDETSNDSTATVELFSSKNIPYENGVVVVEDVGTEDPLWDDDDDNDDTPSFETNSPDDEHTTEEVQSSDAPPSPLVAIAGDNDSTSWTNGLEELARFHKTGAQVQNENEKTELVSLGKENASMVVNATTTTIGSTFPPSIDELLGPAALKFPNDNNNDNNNILSFIEKHNMTVVKPHSDFQDYNELILMQRNLDVLSYPSNCCTQQQQQSSTLEGGRTVVESSNFTFPSNFVQNSNTSISMESSCNNNNDSSSTTAIVDEEMKNPSENLDRTMIEESVMDQDEDETIPEALKGSPYSWGSSGSEHSDDYETQSESDEEEKNPKETDDNSLAIVEDEESILVKGPQSRAELYRRIFGSSESEESEDDDETQSESDEETKNLKETDDDDTLDTMEDEESILVKVPQSRAELYRRIFGSSESEESEDETEDESIELKRNLIEEMEEGEPISNPVFEHSQRNLLNSSVSEETEPESETESMIEAYMRGFQEIPTEQVLPIIIIKKEEEDILVKETEISSMNKQISLEISDVNCVEETSMISQSQGEEDYQKGSLSPPPPTSPQGEKMLEESFDNYPTVLNDLVVMPMSVTVLEKESEVVIKESEGTEQIIPEVIVSMDEIEDLIPQLKDKMETELVPMSQTMLKEESAVKESEGAEHQIIPEVIVSMDEIENLIPQPKDKIKTETESYADGVEIEHGESVNSHHLSTPPSPPPREKMDEGPTPPHLILEKSEKTDNKGTTAATACSPPNTTMEVDTIMKEERNETIPVNMNNQDLDEEELELENEEEGEIEIIRTIVKVFVCRICNCPWYTWEEFETHLVEDHKIPKTFKSRIIDKSEEESPRVGGVDDLEASLGHKIPGRRKEPGEEDNNNESDSEGSSEEDSEFEDLWLTTSESSSSSDSDYLVEVTKKAGWKKGLDRQSSMNFDPDWRKNKCGKRRHKRKIHIPNIIPADISASGDKKDVTCRICKQDFCSRYSLMRHFVKLHGPKKVVHVSDETTGRDDSDPPRPTLPSTESGQNEKRKENPSKEVLLLQRSSEEKTICLNPDRKKPLMCFACKKKFSVESTLDYHLIRLHLTPPTELSCPQCKKPVQNESALEAHLKQSREHILVPPEGSKISKELNGIPVRCGFCDETFLNLKCLNFHIKIHDREETSSSGKLRYRCSICPKSNTTKFVLISALEKHSVTHFIKRCPKCRKILLDDEKLIDHVRVCKHLPKLFQCPVCYKLFKKIGILSQHLKAAHENCAMTCYTCGKVYPTHEELNGHRVNNLCLAAYPCEICEEIFPTPFSLYNHYEKHPKLTPDGKEESQGQSVPSSAMELDASASDKSLTSTCKNKKFCSTGFKIPKKPKATLKEPSPLKAIGEGAQTKIEKIIYKDLMTKAMGNLAEQLSAPGTHLEEPQPLLLHRSTLGFEPRPPPPAPVQALLAPEYSSAIEGEGRTVVNRSKNSKWSIKSAEVHPSTATPNNNLPNVSVPSDYTGQTQRLKLEGKPKSVDQVVRFVPSEDNRSLPIKIVITNTGNSQNERKVISSTSSSNSESEFIPPGNHHNKVSGRSSWARAAGRSEPDVRFVPNASKSKKVVEEVSPHRKNVSSRKNNSSFENDTECVLCDKDNPIAFRSYKELNKHLSKVHSHDYPGSGDALSKSKRSESEKRSPKRGVSQQGESSRGKVDKERSNSERKGNRCESCYLTFPDNDQLGIHMELRHSNPFPTYPMMKKYPCSRCTRVFYDQKSCSDHEQFEHLVKYVITNSGANNKAQISPATKDNQNS